MYVWSLESTLFFLEHTPVKYLITDTKMEAPKTEVDELLRKCLKLLIDSAPPPKVPFYNAKELVDEIDSLIQHQTMNETVYQRQQQVLDQKLLDQRENQRIKEEINDIQGQVEAAKERLYNLKVKYYETPGFYEKMKPLTNNTQLELQEHAARIRLLQKMNRYRRENDIELQLIDNEYINNLAYDATQYKCIYDLQTRYMRDQVDLIRGAARKIVIRSNLLPLSDVYQTDCQRALKLAEEKLDNLQKKLQQFSLLQLNDGRRHVSKLYQESLQVDKEAERDLQDKTRLQKQLLQINRHESDKMKVLNKIPTKMVQKSSVYLQEKRKTQKQIVLESEMQKLATKKEQKDFYDEQ
ncbi:Hypothetical_protein [Hexamita inflata]|uniref:Hypothetical_protein n=1 Tax=Hexamita inflata TaxID=28002 RepID=A0AA86PA90_9EUKA|nr:Hypothetical protein HINF_LOCUS19987 [Hexamita inflata]